MADRRFHDTAAKDLQSAQGFSPVQHRHALRSHPEPNVRHRQETTMTDPRYPVGKFDPADTTPLPEIIAQIERFPAQLRAAVEQMTEAALSTPYRDGGWTARQVVHHVADSHLNSAIRFRMALTADRPTIVAYNEKKWAELDDAAHGPVETSVRLLEALHARWVALLKTMSGEDWQRVFVHPDRGDVTLESAARLYAWHGRHHLAHLGLAVERTGR
jgi:hypothetical protein